jgi:chaperonin GroES
MKDPIKFPLNPVEDWIVIERMNIKSKDEKKILKLGLVTVDSNNPSNILEVERQRKEEYTSYANASTKFLAKWDKHPNQATVKAVGPGRSLKEGVVIPMPVKVGQKVYYRGSTGEPVIVNKKLYYMIKAHEVFGIVP